jgi:formylglycine-generating enzyme required for sulfatase activity
MRAAPLSREFAVGKFAVTFDQFAAFVQETGHDFGTECLTLENGRDKVRTGRSWRNPGFSQSGSHPAVCINRDDAKAYVAWLSRKTSKSYRLLRRIGNMSGAVLVMGHPLNATHAKEVGIANLTS